MTDRLFLDTNILVYAYDSHDPAKQQRAQRLISDGIRLQNATISGQVLGEFFTVVTRKIPCPLGADAAQEVISDLGIIDVVEIDYHLVVRAVETHCRYGVSYWDSLIVAAAERASCTRILSEDLSHGQRYHEMTVENPFS